MTMQTTEPGWKRFVYRVRRLWDEPPRYKFGAPILEHEVTVSVDAAKARPVLER